MGGQYSTEQIPDLSGKVAIVTGASAGIGKVTALELARKGCKVYLAGRSPEKTQKALEEIKTETGNDKLEFLQLDLNSLRSVDKAAKEFKEKETRLHILINNAGIMVTPFGLTEDGIESQFGTNHIGHFHFTTELLPVLEQSIPSRIVNLTSMGHSWPYPEGIRFDKLNEEEGYSSFNAYGQSKLANILFTKELNRRLEGKQIYVNAVHPGYVSTELGRHVSTTFGFVVGILASLSNLLFSTPSSKGALTSLYCATSPEIEQKNLRGEYFVPTAKLSEPSNFAKDEQLAKKLWTFSEELVKSKLGESN